MNLKLTLITIIIIFCLFSNYIAKSLKNYYNEGNKNFLKKEYEKAIENYKLRMRTSSYTTSDYKLNISPQRYKEHKR